MITTKSELLKKLRSYSDTPDDEGVRYKEIIEDNLLHCPELLYALHETDLESELFDSKGNINVAEDGEILGEWDQYFGSTANIRPYLYIPETQTEVKHYVCYQVTFDELPQYNHRQKYTEIKFTIFVHGKDTIDSLTGIPRHDLIASILRERFNWSNIFGMQCRLISSSESLTDNDFVVRTLVFQLVDTNGIVNTPLGEKTQVNNYRVRR